MKLIINHFIKESFAVLFILFFLLSGETFSQQNSDSTLVLTLDKSISIALENNRDIQLSRQDVLKSDAQIDEAYANIWPTIDVNTNYNRNIKSPVLFIPPNTPFNPSNQTETFSLGAKNSFDMTASLSQTIFSLKVNTAIRIANDYSQYYNFSEKSTENNVILQVKKAFYGVLLSNELVKVAQKNYEVSKANYDNISDKYKQGVSSEYDELRAKVQLSNAEPMLIQAKNNLELAKNSLKNLLSIKLNQKIETKGKFELDTLGDVQEDSSATAIVNNNPMITSLNYQISVLDKNISLEKAAYFPTLSGFANYEWQTQDNTFNFNNYNWANTIMVGLKLAIPIFDGFARGARVQQAEIDMEKAKLTKLKTEDGLKIQLVQAELNMKEAKQRVDAQKESVQEAEKALKIAESRYDNGIGTQLEILDTQSALVQTQVSYSQAIYDYLVAKAEWDNVAGYK
jgi:outer membrane protein TolC